MSVSLSKKDYEALVRKSAKASTTTKRKRRRRKKTMRMKLNKVINFIPEAVLLLSLNEATQSGNRTVLSAISEGRFSNAGRIVKSNASDFNTYKPALMAAGGIYGYRLLKRFLR